jgi:hypothetical protein
MGTNYYASKKDAPEPTIWLQPIDLHIGKSSGGWCFALCVNVFKTLDEWIEVFNDPTIIITDEYGRILTPQEMIDVITKRSWNGSATNLKRRTISNNHCIGHGEGTYDLMIGEYC